MNCNTYQEVILAALADAHCLVESSVLSVNPHRIHTALQRLRLNVEPVKQKPTSASVHCFAVLKNWNYFACRNALMEKLNVIVD